MAKFYVKSFMNCLKDELISHLQSTRGISRSQGEKAFSKLLIDEPYLKEPWLRMRPIWIALLIEEFATFNISSLNSPMPILDDYFAELAHYQQKDVFGIETLSEQCDALNQLDQLLQDNSLVSFNRFS